MQDTGFVPSRSFGACSPPDCRTDPRPKPPGSTLFLVWTRNGSDFASGVGDFNFSRDVDALFGAKADNIFLIKLNYWVNR